MPPYLLRMIEKNRWVRPDYVQADDAQADSLLDLRTKGNDLSVWMVEEGSSNLERIITALAAQREHMSNLDYALVDSRDLARLGIKIKNSEGNSPDARANTTWHRDLTELSAAKIANLAKIVAKSERSRVPEKTVKEWIGRAIANRQIDRGILKPGILNKAVMRG